MIVTILRKNLEGTVVDNTLEHGCGGLNIDATRVGNQVMVSRSMGSLGVMHDDNWESKPIEPTESNGRWPANVILTHKDGCELKGNKKVKANIGGGIAKTTIGGHSTYSGGRERVITHYADKDGKEIVANWACVESCSVKTLDRQSGVSKSTGGRIGNAQGVYSNQGRTGWGTGHTKGDPGFGDDGGASRFFKQFKKEDN